MAISIYYELGAPESFVDSDVVRVLQAARKRAISQHFGVVSALNRQVVSAQITYCIESPFESGGVLQLTPTSGFWFKIQLAHSADAAIVGLCRFPASIRNHGREVSSNLGTGWHFQGSCRTQNPSKPEFREFCKRHLGLIDLLRTIQAQEIETEVEDDGEYWKTGDEKVLEQKFRAERDAAPLLDAAFADALEGRAPARRTALFGMSADTHLGSPLSMYIKGS